jgi:hypothetical protein
MLIIDKTKPPGEQITMTDVEPGTGMDGYRGPMAIIDRLSDGRLARVDMENVLVTMEPPELGDPMQMQSVSMKGKLVRDGDGYSLVWIRRPRTRGQSSARSCETYACFATRTWLTCRASWTWDRLNYPPSKAAAKCRLSASRAGSPAPTV